MSHTTTAAASSSFPLSFGWLPTATTTTSTDNDDDISTASPRLDVAALSRRTFVHLDTTSPLARLSHSNLLQSFRDFSDRLTAHNANTHGHDKTPSTRRHTLSAVVVDDLNATPQDPATVRPTTSSTVLPSDSKNIAPSPIARLSSRHSRTFDKMWKDDSYAPNLKRCPSDAVHDKSALMESRDLSCSMSEALLNSQTDEHGAKLKTSNGTDIRKGSAAAQQARLTPLIEKDESRPNSPPSKYFDTLFFPKLTNDNLLDHFSSSMLANRDHPWGSSPAPSNQPSSASVFMLSEWVASLPEKDDDEEEKQAEAHPDGTTSRDKAQHRHRPVYFAKRGSLSKLIAMGSTAKMINLYASPLAQSINSCASNEATKQKNSADGCATTKAEESTAAPHGNNASTAIDCRSGHPSTCKPCAFFWSKGCMNGDECRFCHEWHPPKKKKPMKDQKNLMIIAREDGKIAFLRCAIEHALKHE